MFNFFPLFKMEFLLCVLMVPTKLAILGKTESKFKSLKVRKQKKLIVILVKATDNNLVRSRTQIHLSVL